LLIEIYLLPIWMTGKEHNLSPNFIRIIKFTESTHLPNFKLNVTIQARPRDWHIIKHTCDFAAFLFVAPVAVSYSIPFKTALHEKRRLFDWPSSVGINNGGGIEFFAQYSITAETGFFCFRSRQMRVRDEEDACPLMKRVPFCQI